MKRQLIIGLMAGLTIFGNASGALAASVSEDAYQDARQAVLNRQLVDENQVKQRGDEYASSFLSALAQVGQVYEQAFRQGVNDGLQGHPAQPGGDDVAVTAYQRGFARGQNFRSGNQPAPSDGEVTTNGGMADNQLPEESGPDSSEYPLKHPSPAQAAFIARIAKDAQRIGAEFDLYPSIIIAQAALESNWGTSDLARKPYHNLFGVKGAFQTRSVLQPTVEFDKEGHRHEIKDYFRWYDNDYQSLHDYAQTLEDPLYDGVHRRAAKSYRQATHALLGRYATDPHYDRKLNEIISNFQLTKYDHQPQRTAMHRPAVFKEPPMAPTSSHEVKASRVHHPHRVTWLSILGGAGSAGAITLLRRFALVK